MSHRLIVGGLDDGDEIALPQHRVLRDHPATEVGDFLVDLLQPIGVFVQGLASLGVRVLNKMYVGMMPSSLNS